jgi:hypothetical protein
MAWPLCILHFIVEPSEGFNLNNDRKGLLCYVFICKNLKELGVLWVWSKNLFNRKRGHGRQKRTGKEGAISKSKLH